MGEQGYLSNLGHVVRLIVQLLNDAIESRGNLLILAIAPRINKLSFTSTDALSDCTSQMGSNCSTRAPGLTNHWITWHSVIPRRNTLSLDQCIYSLVYQPSPISASKYGLTTNSPLVSRNPLLCSCTRMLALLRPAIDARWARFDREKRRDASLLAKDFIVDRVCQQIFSAEKTYPSAAAEVWCL